MKLYKCSLKSWREKLSDAPLSQTLPLYLKIFSQALDALSLLRSNSTVFLRCFGLSEEADCMCYFQMWSTSM